MVILCLICDTQNEALGGLRVVFRVFIIFSSKCYADSLKTYFWSKKRRIHWLQLSPFALPSGDTATCLHNAPHEDEALGRALPGTLLSLDAQCRRDRGTSACFKDERVCAQLFCFDAASGYCVAYRPAAEGSSCGDGLVSMQVAFCFQ